MPYSRSGARHRSRYSLLVFEVQRTPHPTTTRSAQLHEVSVALELHEGGEEDVQALDDVVVDGNIHHRTNLVKHK